MTRVQNRERWTVQAISAHPLQHPYVKLFQEAQHGLTLRDLQRLGPWSKLDTIYRQIGLLRALRMMIKTTPPANKPDRLWWWNGGDRIQWAEGHEPIEVCIFPLLERLHIDFPIARKSYHICRTCGIPHGSGGQGDRRRRAIYWLLPSEKWLPQPC